MTKTLSEIIQLPNNSITRQQVVTALLDNGFKLANGVDRDRYVYGKYRFDLSLHITPGDAAQSLASLVQKIARDKATTEKENFYPLPADLQGEFQAHQKRGAIFLAPKEFPYISVDVNMNAGENPDEALRNCAVYISKQIKETIRKTSLELREENGSLLVLQPDLGIETLLHKRESHFFQHLMQAIHDANERRIAREHECLDSIGELEKWGYTNDLLPCPSYEVAHKVPLITEGQHLIIPTYGDSIIPRNIADKLKALSEGKGDEITDPQPSTEIPTPSKINSYVIHLDSLKPSHPWLKPLPQGKSEKGIYATADIVLDATTLSILSTKTNKVGQSLIGLLPHIAELPTVHSIVIPSIIADWEKRGLVPENEGLLDISSKDRQIELNKQNRNFAELQYLLSNATRRYYDEDDKLQKETPGKFKNIIIYDSARQRKVLAPLVKMHQELKGNEKYHAIADFSQDRENGGKNKGEKAIDEYIDHIIASGRNAYVVSDDREYRDNLESRMGNQGGRLKSGGQVNIYNTASLIGSLLDKNHGKPAMESMSTKAFSLDQILELLRQNGNEIQQINLKRPISISTIRSAKKTISLGEVLSVGASLASRQQHIPRFTQGKTEERGEAAAPLAGTAEKSQEDLIEKETHRERVVKTRSSKRRGETFTEQVTPEKEAFDLRDMREELHSFFVDSYGCFMTPAEITNALNKRKKSGEEFDESSIGAIINEDRNNTARIIDPRTIQAMADYLHDKQKKPDEAEKFFAKANIYRSIAAEQLEEERPQRGRA